MIVVIPLFVPALQFSANATKCNVAPKKVFPTPLPKKTLVCSLEIKGLFSSQYIKQAPIRDMYNSRCFDGFKYALLLISVKR